MPRRKLLRRFEPRYGVTEPMLEAESIWVGREFHDYLNVSIDQLRKWLGERQINLATAEANLQFVISRLPDRERLAIRAMIARDLYHIAALYERFLRQPEIADATGPVHPAPEELKEDEPKPVIPFSEWLFS